MGFFNFWDIDWGSNEAKGDKHLKDYFVQIPEYEDIKTGKYRYIIGRKGSGKTAICERIKIAFQHNSLSFSSSLNLRNFPISYIRDLRDKSFREKSQFVPVWSFLILVELSKLILEDMGARPCSIIEEIKVFLNNNSFINNIGFVNTIETLKKNQSKIKVSPAWLCAEITKENSQTATIPVHFQCVSNILLEKLQMINSESSFFLFMDELDEGYRAGDSGLCLILLALLQAAEDIAINFQDNNINVLPIVALRSDIFDRLEDNDLNKIDDYTVRINGRSTEVPDYYLKNIPNDRIAFSLLKGLAI
jgi:hypothetical protein